jgi:NAD-dependent dihydropyrimidine dehydrogenase PreA subunit
MRRYSVITEKCSLELHCISACLRNAIHPTAAEAAFQTSRQLFINPRKCIGCGSCMSACENGAIFEMRELPPNFAHFVEMNAAYYSQ